MVEEMEEPQENMKLFAFWNVEPCSLAEFDRRFRDAYCLHHQD
jgi:hypothetical protein